MVSKMPRAPAQLDLDKTIVIEVCENCSSHQWNTRHDANKYANHAHQSKCPRLTPAVAAAIKKLRPDVIFTFN